MFQRLRALLVLGVLEPLRALGRNKVRSALAAVGITIGIAAVVCVSAIGQAGAERAEEQLHNLGDNLVWVEAGSRNVNGVRTGSHGTTTLTVEDADAILREVPLIKAVSPQVDGSVSVAVGNRNWVTHYRGVSPDYLDIKRFALAEGSVFTDQDVREAASVCLIGKTLREQLFGEEQALQRQIRIGSGLCTIVGLLAPKGQSASGQDQDDVLLLPFTTAQKKLRGRGYTWLDDILCSAVSPEAVAPAVEQVSALMKQRHHIEGDAELDFNLRRPDELIKAQIEASRTLSWFLITVASISLLVGGVGVMNVMLVSVTQRTREIGLRLAVGAEDRDVRLQFLGESVVLSALGGFAGIGLGVATSILLARALEWPMTIPIESLAIAPLFSCGIGVVFGLYPAIQASRLDPIVALKYE